MVIINYIDENLEKVINNPDKVLYLRTYDVRNKSALFAVLKEDTGIYKKVQITKEQSKMIYPWEPLLWFDTSAAGNLLLKDFIILNSNNLALNKNNIDGFKIIKNGNFGYNIEIYAVFSDGTATFVRREREKTFNRNGGIDSFNKLLENYKDNKVNNNKYHIIEFFAVNGSDIIEIPNLRNLDQINEEKAPVKKLGSKPSSNK